MKRRVVHQWKDWILEYVDENQYELTHKYSQSVQTVVAKNAMDAENQCRQIMENLKDENT
jgi:hypothetical protein